jgi:hypothetical protein
MSRVISSLSPIAEVHHNEGNRDRVGRRQKRWPIFVGPCAASARHSISTIAEQCVTSYDRWLTGAAERPACPNPNRGTCATSVHDRLAAHELVSRYWFLYDEGRLDELADLLADDCHLRSRTETGQHPFEEFIGSENHGRDLAMAWTRESQEVVLDSIESRAFHEVEQVADRQLTWTT